MRWTVGGGDSERQAVSVALGVVAQAEQHPKARGVDEIDSTKVQRNVSDSCRADLRHRLPELVGGREVQFAHHNDRDLVTAVLDRDREGPVRERVTPHRYAATDRAGACPGSGLPSSRPRTAATSTPSAARTRRAPPSGSASAASRSASTSSERSPRAIARCVASRSAPRRPGCDSPRPSGRSRAAVSARTQARTLAERGAFTGERPRRIAVTAQHGDQHMLTSERSRLRRQRLLAREPKHVTRRLGRRHPWSVGLARDLDSDDGRLGERPRGPVPPRQRIGRRRARA